MCPDEAHLAALLHHLGTEVAVIAQVCADVRHGKMALLLVAVAAKQLQACFPPIPQAHARTRSACPARVSPPVAAVWRHDVQQSAARPPRSHALWVHAREAREEADKLREEFALLLEETALVMGASRQRMEEGKSNTAGWESPARGGWRCRQKAADVGCNAGKA
jgi:hypothetical protein